MARSRFSCAVSTSPKASSILRRTEPEPLRSRWENASCSPWMSEAKISVPFGRLSTALKLMISADASAMVGNDWDSSRR